MYMDSCTECTCDVCLLYVHVWILSLLMNKLNVIGCSERDIVRVVSSQTRVLWLLMQTFTSRSLFRMFCKISCATFSTFLGFFRQFVVFFFKGGYTSENLMWEVGMWYGVHKVSVELVLFHQVHEWFCFVYRPYNAYLHRIACCGHVMPTVTTEKANRSILLCM